MSNKPQDNQPDEQSQGDSQADQSRGEAELQQAQAKIEELTNDLKRARADYINYKRRNQQQQAQVMTSAKREVVKQLLPLIDDLKRSVGHLPEELSDNSWAQGIQQIARQADDVLAEMGVERIPAEGEEFDPNLHEAVSIEGDDSGRQTVKEELQAGYKLGDTVIRPSRVVVANNGGDSQEQVNNNQQEENDE